MRQTETPHEIINKQSIDRIKRVTWDSHPLTQERTESSRRYYAYQEAFGTDEWDTYAFGYKTAVNILADDLQNGNGRWDGIAIPLVFNFRHHLELMLKSGTALREIARQQFEKIPKHHDIAPLWDAYRAELVALRTPSKAMIRMDKLVHDFAILEKKTEAWRFPTEIDWVTKTARFGHELLNPGLVGEVAQEMISYIEISDIEIKKSVYPGWDDSLRHMKHMFKVVNEHTERQRQALAELLRKVD